MALITFGVAFLAILPLPFFRFKVLFCSKLHSQRFNDRSGAPIAINRSKNFFSA
jgi:hypothetical protein